MNCFLCGEAIGGLTLLSTVGGVLREMHPSCLEARADTAGEALRLVERQEDEKRRAATHDPSAPPLPWVLPDDDGIRPAGRPDECFYCLSRVGQEHGADCAILQRKVRVRYSFTLEIEVPHHWGEGEILFHRNEGSWCADNAVDELDELRQAREEAEAGPGCLCDDFECEVVEIPEAAPYRRNKEGEVVP